MSVEELLCASIGRKHCILVGRATSAIFIALKSLERHGKVIVPAITCPNPASAVVYSGLDIVFSDCRTSDYTIDPEEVAQIVRSRSNIAAILAVNLFGHPCDFSALRNAAPGIPIIEDAAQALGGEYIGQKIGTFGDISILSFSANKILGLEGGGAILCDDDNYAARAREAARTLAPMRPDTARMQAAYRNLYYSVRELEEFGIDTAALYLQFTEAFKPMYLHAVSDSQKAAIENGIGTLSEEIKLRRKKANLYRNLLTHDLIEHPEVDFDKAVCWRYSFLFKGSDCKRFTALVREKIGEVSNWYPSITSWFGDAGMFKNAEEIEGNIVNLWTDSLKDEGQIIRDCAQIITLLEAEDPRDHHTSG